VVKPQRRSQPERRAATRQAILQAAARLFAERGYQAVSLDEIAAAAGYTRGAVHYNFSGKHELLQTLLDDNLAARGAAVAAADPSSVATTLPYDRQTSLLFLEFAAAAARDPQIGRALLAALDAGRERNRGAIEALLDPAGAPAEQADELAAIVGAFVNGLSIEALAGADIQMLEARFSRLVEILLDDLRHGGQAER
jgi:AcrR family transcriptional regulator